MVRKRSLAWEQRQENILLSLKKLDYLTTTQLLRLHNLKSARNALRVMTQMSDYVTYFRDGENVYYLNANGREKVNSEKVRKKTSSVTHFLARNNLYLALGMPSTWRNEMNIISKGATDKETVAITADAIFKREDTWHIVEVDNLQNMRNNRHKIERYRILMNRGAFGARAPRFIWVTRTELRARKLKAWSDGMNCTVYTELSLI